MEGARPEVGAAGAALDGAVEEAEEVRDEEDDQDLGDLVVDVHEIFLVGFVGQRLEVPVDAVGDAQVDVADEDGGGRHEGVEPQELEVVVRRLFVWICVVG